MIKLLDVSSCQGVIAWDKVPAEYRGVIIKATEGTTGVDPTHARNMHEAHASGRFASYYHFCRPSQDPIAQVANLWKSIGDTMPDFRPALDLENAPDSMTPDALAAWFIVAADEAERYFGVPPMVYTYPWFYTSRLSHAAGITGELGARIKRCPLWMADYSKGETPSEGVHPFVPLPWDTWTMWQTSGDKSSHVAGIAGAVDHDVFNGDEAAFAAFRGAPRPDQLEPDAPTVHDLPNFGEPDHPND